MARMSGCVGLSLAVHLHGWIQTFQTTSRKGARGGAAGWSTVEAIMSGLVVAAAIVAIVGIAGTVIVVLRVAQGIRRESRPGSLYGTNAPCRASRTARKWTGMGARWA